MLNQKAKTKLRKRDLRYFDPQALIDFRLRRGIGIEEMARKVHMKISDYIKIEAETQGPKLNELVAIAKVLGIRARDLLSKNKK